MAEKNIDEMIRFATLIVELREQIKDELLSVNFGNRDQRTFTVEDWQKIGTHIIEKSDKVIEMIKNLRTAAVQISE